MRCSHGNEGAQLVIGHAKLHDTGLLSVMRPPDGRFRVLGLAHLVYQPKVVKTSHQFISFGVAEAIAPTVLDKFKFRIDALAKIDADAGWARTMTATACSSGTLAPFWSHHK